MSSLLLQSQQFDQQSGIANLSGDTGAQSGLKTLVLAALQSAGIAMQSVFWHAVSVEREAREALNEHRATLVWLTGLSGSGKSTLAHAIEKRLHLAGHRTFVLDGDNVRHGLCANLDFTATDRTENIRRVAEVARLFLEAGVIVLAAFISPLRAQREMVRQIVGTQDYIEVYCRCPLPVCVERDPKGLYRKALTGEIADFTGISAPYDAPLAPDLVVDTDRLPLDTGINRVIDLLIQRAVVRAERIVPARKPAHAYD